MAKFRPGLRQIARALLIRGIAALLLLQTIALAYSQARPAPSEPGLAAAGQICRPLSDGGHAPARSDGAGHCLFCPISCAHGGAALATLLATAIRLLAPPRRRRDRPRDGGRRRSASRSDRLSAILARAAGRPDRSRRPRPGLFRSRAADLPQKKRIARRAERRPLPAASAPCGPIPPPEGEHARSKIQPLSRAVSPQ